MHHRLANAHQPEKVLVARFILVAEHRVRDKQYEVALTLRRNGNL